eukprot:748606-Hanusia_phi.AAC.1
MTRTTLAVTVRSPRLTESAAAWQREPLEEQPGYPTAVRLTLLFFMLKIGLTLTVFQVQHSNLSLEAAAVS